MKMSMMYINIKIYLDDIVILLYEKNKVNKKCKKVSKKMLTNKNNGIIISIYNVSRCDISRKEMSR